MVLVGVVHPYVDQPSGGDCPAALVASAGNGVHSSAGSSSSSSASQLTLGVCLFISAAPTPSVARARSYLARRYYAVRRLSS